MFAISYLNFQDSPSPLLSCDIVNQKHISPLTHSVNMHQTSLTLHFVCSLGIQEYLNNIVYSKQPKTQGGLIRWN